MSSDAAPRSRRALLTAGLAAGVATVASALGRPLPVKAASGTFDSASSSTPAVQGANSYTGGGNGAWGVYGQTASISGMAVGGSADAASGSTFGVFGSAASTEGTGVRGQANAASGSTVGVFGIAASTAGTGVRGEAYAASGSTIGVSGSTASPDGVGVQGSSEDIGVAGISTAASGFHNGVYGAAAADDGNGVWGQNSSLTGYTGGVAGQVQSPTGAGAWGVAPGDGTGAMGISGVDPGTAPSKVGVYGLATQATGAIGVQGNAPAGVGVLATTTTGIALQVAGKAKFSRAGRASVPKGKLSADITVAGGLAANSVVSATLQTYRAGVGIAAVRTNYPVAGKARIYLTKVASTTAATSVGWFVAEY